MGKIINLSPEIISKIAAGEVIERPAYAVKELVENSIDAKADFIKIDIEHSGLKKIIVQDNGEGMDEHDLKKCYQPHTTSKLEDANLVDINFLGFRGEALSSISAISNLKISSKRKQDKTGFFIELVSGNLLDSGPIGLPVGTTVSISNLFYPVPARKKFLKTERTEFRNILEVLSCTVLAHPNIRFLLTHNKKIIFDLPANQSLEDRIKYLIGPTIHQNLIPIKFEESYLKLHGYICKPQVTTTNSSKQFIFINKRYIKDSLISSAIKESYSTLLESTSLPIFILFIELPKQIIDVNVHPKKEQVKFSDSQLVFDTIQKAVSQTLQNNNLTFYNLSWKGSDSYNNNHPHFFDGSLTKTYAGKLLKEEVLPFLLDDLGQINYSEDVLQIHNTYLLCQTKTGLSIIDQHAAHERVLFEKFQQAFNNQKHKKEILQLPQSLLFELSPSDTQLLIDQLPLFQELGIILQQFGDNTFKIEAIPVLFQDRDIVKLINETLEDIKNFGTPKQLDHQSKKMLSYLACRSAIKAGDKLTKQQIKDLIKEYKQYNTVYTCPHGRPVQIELSLSHLHKMFKRI